MIVAYIKPLSMLGEILMLFLAENTVLVRLLAILSVLLVLSNVDVAYDACFTMMACLTGYRGFEAFFGSECFGSTRGSRGLALSTRLTSGGVSR